jgi:hypothetical protein
MNFVQKCVVSSRVWKIHSLMEAKSTTVGASVKSKNALRANTSQILQRLPQDFAVTETTQFTEPAHVLYTVLPVDLSAGDVQAVNEDPAHVPKPIPRPNARWSFQVPLTSSVR